MFAVVIVFAPTLSTYFSQDDWVFLSHTYKQPFIKIFDHHPEAFYRPVGQQLFFWLGSNIFGLDAGGFHLFGVSIHIINIVLLWKLLKYKNFFLMLFYAVNPAHFVALNWLTQIDIEIAVGFGLASIYLLKSDLSARLSTRQVRQGLTFLDVIRKTGVVLLFLFGILSHEVVVFLPVVWWIWFKQKRMAVLGLAAGLFLVGAKFLVNPFSPNADYTVSTNILGILSTLKWYGLRALFIPEGVRNFPFWLTIGSLITPVLSILIFRQRIIKGTLFYFLGILPVLGFGNHLLAAYAIFGIALMTVELGRRDVIPAKAGIYLNRFRVKPGMTMILLSVIIVLSSVSFVYFTYSNHWSTARGIISRRLTNEYFISGTERRPEILARAENFKENPEIYFSSMMGRQYGVLDKGGGSGIIDFLFYRGNDMTTQFLPDARYFKESILAKKFPVWNPWIMAGMPYFLDPQNFLWYPPNYLLLLMPLELGFLILLIGHLIFAGEMMKKILGHFGYLGYLGAAMFVLSPKIISHIEEGNWSLVIASCWLPFLYWALKNKRFNLTAISLVAVIINNLNIGYYSMLFIAIYYLIVVKMPGPSAAKPGLKMLKIFIVSAILTIPRWLPLLIFGNQTVRADLQEQPLPFWSWTKIIKSLFFPLAGGHPLLQNEEILYVGIAPVLVITVYLLWRLGRLGKIGKPGRFWIIWLGFISLVAINLKTPFYFLIKLFPGFSLLRITTRPWIFVGLALAVFVPGIVGALTKRSKLLVGAVVFIILLEFAYFDYGIFSRRQVIQDDVPFRFYQTMVPEGPLIRAYCTTGCLNRLKTQELGIAILGGNNPVQLTSFVNYLQKAGGYTETSYFPILPPYTVFSQQPQPNAELLAQTATKFVVSPYELRDNNLKLVDQEGKFRLYRNDAKMIESKDHHFELY